MTTLEQATLYTSAGLSVIPLKQVSGDVDRSKEPACFWKDFQGRIATQAELATWFGNGHSRNVGLITGRISGDLVAVDFDQPGMYERWTAAYPEIAASTATAKTGKGYHVLLRLTASTPGNYAPAFFEGEPIGETRGEGGYIVVWPSIHGSGAQYIWIRPPWDGIAIVESLDAVGITRKRPEAKTTAGPVSNNGGGNRYVEAALKSELDKLAQTGEGNRNHQLNVSAFVLGQLVAVGLLDRSLVEQQLEQVALGTGLTEREIRATIKSGIEAGLLQPRQIPERQGNPAGQPPTGGKASDHVGEAPSPDENPAGQPSQDTPSLELEQDKEPAVVDLFPTYIISKGRTVYQQPVKSKGVIIGYTPVTVAAFTAAITEEIITEDGIRFFRIEGKTRLGQPFALEISTDDFSSDNKLKAALVGCAGAKAAVAANMGKHLAPAIHHFTAARIRRIKRYERTGWTNEKRFLLPGREAENVTIELPRKLPFALNPLADLDKGLVGFYHLLHAAPAEKSTVALAFLLQGPAAGPAGWRESDRYALFATGQTGTYKTSFFQCGMCFYGPDFIRDDTLIRFGDGATKLAMQKYATHAHDLPLLIDNYKPGVPPGEAGFYALLHAMVEGGEKDRLNRNSELKDSKAIYTWPIFTGEDIPDKDAASLARVLKLEWTGGDSDRLGQAQALASHLAAVGVAWIEWLESPEGRLAAQEAGAKFQAYRARWAKLLKEHNKDAQNAMRVASNLASNELTFELMCHPGSPVGLQCRSEYLPEAHHRGLQAVALSMANETAASVEATRFLHALQEILHVREYSGSADGYKELRTDSDVLVGWQDSRNEFYLKMELARKAVDDLLRRDGLNQVTNNKLYAQLDALGLIASRGSDGKTTQNKWFNGEQGRVLHLVKKALLVL